MITVKKFVIEESDDMIEDSIVEFLSARAVEGKIVIWALIDTALKPETYGIIAAEDDDPIAATGEADLFYEGWNYLATVGRKNVRHIFWTKIEDWNRIVKTWRNF